MDYYGNNDWRDYLAHYGVKGMKWRKHKYARKIGEEYEYNLPDRTITGRYFRTGKDPNSGFGVYRDTYKGRSSYGLYAPSLTSRKQRTYRIGNITVDSNDEGTSIDYKKRSGSSASKKPRRRISSRQIKEQLSNRGSSLYSSLKKNAGNGYNKAKNKVTSFFSKKKSEYEYNKNFKRGAKYAKSRTGYSPSAAEQRAIANSISSIRSGQKKRKKR